MRFGSLFSGIGGLDLGLERAGMECVWQSEIDPYASRVLAKHWPNIPNLGDINGIEWNRVPPVDVICGGFPCQDLSYAGLGAGMDGARSGLWSHYARLVGELRPAYVLVENVAALLGRGIERVLGDLAGIGYDAEWHCIPARYVGAPHGRDRIWIIADPQRDEQSRQEPRSGKIGRVGRKQQSVPWDTDWESALSKFRRMDDGLPRSVASTDGYRNAVVPQIPELIGYSILEATKGE